MQATNYLLRPLVRDEGDPQDAWEVCEIITEDLNTIVAKRVGQVTVPPMGYTPLTFLQFLLSSLEDQRRVGGNDVVLEGEYTQV